MILQGSLSRLGGSWGYFLGTLGFVCCVVLLSAVDGKYSPKLVEYGRQVREGILGGSWKCLGIPKTHQNRKRNQTSKKYLFETVLGASCGDLGAFSLPSRAHRMHSPSSGASFLKNHIFLKNRVLDQFLANLSTQKGQKGPPNGAQKGPKTSPEPC